MVSFIKFYFFLNTYNVHVHNNKISIFNEIEKIRDIQIVMCTLRVHKKSFDHSVFTYFYCDSN